MRMVLPGRDIPWKDFLLRLKDEVKDDNLSAVAGGVTFAALLSLFPFLIFLVALAGILIDPAQIQALVDQLKPVAPPEGVALVESYLTNLTKASSGGLLTFGALGALWSAGRGVKAFIHALNVTYNCPEDRPAWKVQLLAAATVLTTSVGLVVLIAVVVALPAITDALQIPFLHVLTWLRLPFAGLLLLLVWAAYDRILPARSSPYRPFTFGNLLGVGLWLVVSWAFSVYVQNFGNYNATYGAIGGVIVLLLWMNLSVQVFLLAAEVNGVLEDEERRGAAAAVATGEDLRSPAPQALSVGAQLRAGEAPPTGVERRMRAERDTAAGARSAGAGVKVGALALAVAVVMRQWRAVRQG